MPLPNLLVLGAGGHARACIDVIEQEGKFQIAGLVGSGEEIGTKVSGYPVLGTDSDLPELGRKYQFAFLALGQIKSPDPRVSLYETARKIGFHFPAIVSPSAYISRNARIGDGTIVMHGAIVNAGASIGHICTINSRALIEHDCTLESCCHISTGAILNGGVKIGAGTFIGSGTVIKEGLNIGERCVIGMGSVVRANLESHSRFTGQK